MRRRRGCEQRRYRMRCRQLTFVLSKVGGHSGGRANSEGAREGHRVVAVVGLCECEANVCCAESAANGCNPLSVGYEIGVLVTQCEGPAGNSVGHGERGARDARGNRRAADVADRVGVRQVNAEVAHRVDDFNAVTANAGRRVGVGTEVGHNVREAEAGETDGAAVEAGHRVDCAVDVASADGQAACGHGEARCVGAEHASCGACVVSLEANACAEGQAAIGFCRCVDVEAEARLKASFRNSVLNVEDAETGQAGHGDVSGCNASGRNQSRRSEKTL